MASTHTLDCKGGDQKNTQGGHRKHTSCAAFGSQRSSRGNQDKPAAAGRAGVVARISVKESKALTAPTMKKVTAPSVLQCSNAERASQ